MLNATSDPGSRQSFTTSGGSYPDLSFIKKHIPIAEVALKLGLQVTGRAAHCWRPENHQHGDRTPSVGFQKQKNIGKCFVCDDHAWSNVDLVKMVLGYTTRQAIDWIASHFSVPQIPKGKHLARREQWDSLSRVGTSGFSLEPIVRSGFGATLSRGELAVLVVFCTFAYCAPFKISYRGIMRYAGIGSYSTVSRVLKRLEQLGLLEIVRSSENSGLRACNSYLLTLESAKFQKLLRDTNRRNQEEIAVERQIRADQKKARRAERQTTPVNPLYSPCSAEPFGRYSQE